MPIGAGHMKRVKDVEARAYSTPGACGYCRDNKDTVNADGSVTKYWEHCDSCAASNKTWGAPDAEKCTWMIQTDNQGPSQNVNPQNSNSSVSMSATKRPEASAEEAAAPVAAAAAQSMLPMQSPFSNRAIFAQDCPCEAEDVACIAANPDACA